MSIVNMRCFFIICLYLYCRWRSNHQEREGWDLINWLNPATFCTCPKPRPEFPTSYVMVFFYVQRFEVRGDSLLCWYWWNCVDHYYCL